jgi:hypothetical protein
VCGYLGGGTRARNYSRCARHVERPWATCRRMHRAQETRAPLEFCAADAIVKVDMIVRHLPAALLSNARACWIWRVTDRAS